MSLADSLEKLYGRRRFGIRPGIGRILPLLERLGHPEQAFRSIHVVGTNGKGSTSAFLASILGCAGYRTALFTSPHLLSFTERLRINGREISADRLAPLLETVLSKAPDDATFFEVITSLASLYFAEEQVDIAVMEAGMGGISDATSAIPGIMTLITPISLDHCDYLGATLTEIASEKASIAEPGTPIVTAYQTSEVHEAIRKRAESGGNDFIVAQRDFTSFWDSNGSLVYNGIHVMFSGILPGIPGRYQSENAALSLAAAEILSTIGMTIGQEALTSRLSSAHWPGRMELLHGSPPILLDCAHNPAGAASLSEALKDYRYRRLLLVTGVIADKDVGGMFSLLVGKVDRGYAVAPAVERALDDVGLARILGQLGIEAAPYGSVANGIEAARRDAGEDDLILVCGSLFTVGETKAWLTKTCFVGIRG